MFNARHLDYFSSRFILSGNDPGLLDRMSILRRGPRTHYLMCATSGILSWSNQILPIGHSIIVQFLKLINVNVVNTAVIIIIFATTTWRGWGFVLITGVKKTSTARIATIFFQHFYSSRYLFFRHLNCTDSKSVISKWRFLLIWRECVRDPMWASAVKHQQNSSHSSHLTRKAQLRVFSLQKYIEWRLVVNWSTLG